MIHQRRKRHANETFYDTHAIYTFARIGIKYSSYLFK